MNAQIVSKKKNKSLKCSQEVRNIPLERFRLPDDARKWRQAARSRSALLCRLATYANADGTFVRDGRNYSPSLKTLLNHIAKASYFRITDSLQTLGLLSWSRERHHERRIYTIHLPEQVSDSPEQVSDSQITGLTSVNHPSLPSLPLKERAEKPTEAASLACDSKPTAADRKYAKDLVDEIKRETMAASEGKAVFYKTHRQALEAVILKSNPDREAVLAAVRSRVSDMSGDSFRLSHCGSELAECLAALVQYKADKKAAQQQQESDSALSIKLGEAKAKAERDEILARIAAEDALAMVSPF